MLEPITNSMYLGPLFLAVLLHFVWQATLVIALVAIVQSLVHQRFFRFRYVIAVLGLFAVLAAPMMTTAFYLSSPDAMATLLPTVGSEGGSTADFTRAIGFTSLLEAQFETVFVWFDDHRSFWLGGWFVGFAVLSVRLCVSLGHCFQLRRRQKPLPPQLQNLAEELRAKLNLTRRVVVASSQEITQAVATGIIRPVVLIPTSWLTQLPLESLEAVLAHELAHLKRWDLWINLLQRFAETVFFFHPLVWWLSKRISNEREVCCDHLAIQATGRPVQYVETLAQVAGAVNVNEIELQFGTAFIGGKNMNLLRRAKMILEPSSIDAQSPFRTLALIACTGLMISYGSYAYCATPGNALASVQDHDIHHDHDHDHDHAHDHDSDHPHDVQRHNRDHNVFVRKHKNEDGEFEFVVIGEDHDDKNSNRLHGTLVELLHQNDSGNVSNRELAQRLRRLADRLESETKDSPNVSKKIRRRVEIRRDRDLPVERQIKKNEIIDLTVDTNDFEVETRDEPVRRYLHMHKQDDHGKTAERRYLYRLEGKVPEGEYRFHVRPEHQDFLLRRKYDVHQAHGPHDEHARLERRHTNDRHFGHATTSDGDLSKVLSDLKNEVRQLRREVNQLRSGKKEVHDRPVRIHVEEKRKPERFIELKQLEGELKQHEDIRKHPHTGIIEYRWEAKPGKQKTDNVWVESKVKDGNVWYDFEIDADTQATGRWIEKKKPGSKKTDSRRYKADAKGNMTLDLEFKSDKATPKSESKKGAWTIELEDIKDGRKKDVQKKAGNWLVELKDSRDQPKTRLRDVKEDRDHSGSESKKKASGDSKRTNSVWMIETPEGKEEMTLGEIHFHDKDKK